MLSHETATAQPHFWRKYLVVGAIAALLWGLGLWAAFSWVGASWSPYAGAFGDSFAPLALIASAAALGLAFKSLSLQRVELEQNRQVLILQLDEMRESKAAQKALVVMQHEANMAAREAARQDLESAQMQLSEARRSSEAQRLFDLMMYLQSDEARSARRIVLEKGRKAEAEGTLDRRYENWSSEHQEAASSVAATYATLAIAIENNVVPKQAFVTGWAASIRDCHKYLEKYLEHVRALMGQDYLREFDRLLALVTGSSTEISESEN